MQITKQNLIDIPQPQPQQSKTLACHIKKDELVRLMLQTLYDLGYSILQGQWQIAESLLPQIPFLFPTHVPKVQFLIRQQKFLELLEQSETMKALHVLRTEITPLGQNTDRLHLLTSLVLCSSIEDVMQQASWDGTKGTSREQLLNQIQHHIDPAAMIPKQRLLELINQSLEWQKRSCLYHNPRQGTEFSLFSDHMCDKSLFPTHTIHVLLSGSYCAWSPDDSRLLVCGTDFALRLWDPFSGILLHTFSFHKDQVTSCVWIDHQHFISGACDKVLCLWNSNSTAPHAQPITRWPVHRTTDMKLSTDGKRFVTIGLDKTISIYEVEGLRILETAKIQEEGVITSLTLTKDGKYALVNVQDVQELHLWDLDKQQIVHKYSGQKQITYIIRSTLGGHNESFVLSGSEEGHENTVNCVSWCPIEPMQFVSASDDHTIRV
ncbi:WD40-repeat-containing domain protein [Gilbertella persicaria]|uniref:WD40-repeat-containing domain protein n=1 Tax=Gilbertella persicaria TaxID=101096 RepID=UPI00221FA846|nr:WD40-repeat-containing domain protein [Gilbertella persicaria]KAI8072196.1 WD40-repeat-containing domain protein [Gilbertella persicaria]